MNDNAVLECLSHSLPTTEFEWYKGAARVTGEDHTKITVTEQEYIKNRQTVHVSTLDIIRVSATDLGSYKCLGRNLLGSNYVMINLLKKSKCFFRSMLSQCFIFSHENFWNSYTKNTLGTIYLLLYITNF